MSYQTLHKINDRATPMQMMLYKHAIILYKIFNNKQPPQDWLELNFTQLHSNRQTHFECINNARFKVGNNTLSNRFAALNNKLPLTWLNLQPIAYKLKCKKEFL